MYLRSKTTVGSDSGILSRYGTLAAGSLLASVATFESVDAALVFSTPDLTLDPDADPVDGRIDLDGDGVAEVGVLVDSASFPDSAGNNGAALGGGLFGASIAFTGRYPTALHASDYVTADMDFRTDIGVLAWSSIGLLGSRGGWFAGGDAYLGARFQINDDYFYGWVHALWDAGSKTMRLDMAAYETSGGAAHVIAQPAEPENFQLNLGSIFDPAGGRIEWIWPTLAGKTYELQRSLDLDQWQTIYTVKPTIDGEATYLDDEFSSAPKEKCYYRVKQSETSKSSLLLLALGVPRRKRREWISDRTTPPVAG